MSKTRNQKCFTISAVTAGWNELWYHKAWCSQSQGLQLLTWENWVSSV